MKDLAVVSKNNALIQNTAWDSLSENTKLAYGKDFDQFFEFIKKNPEDVTSSDILAYFEHLQSLDRSNDTINRKMASLSKMFKVLLYAGKIQKNPVDELKQFKRITLKTVKNYHPPIDINDVKKLAKITKKMPLQEKKIAMIIKILMKTGFRISEFTGALRKKMAPYDEHCCVIKITGKGKKEREMFLDYALLNELYEYWPKDESIPYIFYNKNRNRYCRKYLWAEVVKHAEKRIKKHVHPHMMRHACATYMLVEMKLPIKVVQEFLGHSDSSTTMVYLDASPTPDSTRINI